MYPLLVAKEEIKLLKQYQGKEGERRRVEIFKNSDILKFSPILAQKLAQIAKIIEYQEGKVLFEKGDPATGYLTLFFLERLNCLALMIG